MRPFLKSVADYILGTFQEYLDQVCIIFPNKRASLFLNKYLALHLNQPVWAPYYSTISELMNGFSGLVPGDPLVLQYELYKAYCKVHANPEPFEQFYNWGLTILADFDDIDKYRIDAGQLFLNLSDLKEIEERFDFLSPNQKEIIHTFWGNAKFDQSSPLKNDFLNFWQELGTIFPIFKQQLTNRNIAYEGMIYREASTKVKHDAEIPLPYKHYCFVGFNALNECEKVLFDFFKKSGKASFFWDYDDYYVQNDWHEAGLFLRDNIRRYPAPGFELNTNDLSRTEKKIQIIAANNDVAQAKILSRIIEPELAGKDNTTAVVLSDESLLVPVLSSLPESVQRINITMGYPFANSPAFTLLELVIQLFRNERKHSETGRLFHHREVMALLNHPYIRLVFPTESGELQKEIFKANRAFVQLDEFQAFPVMRNVFDIPETDRLYGVAAFFQEIGNRLETLPETDVPDIQYVLALYSQANILANLIREEGIPLSGNAGLRFLKQLAQRIKVSFIGEPLTDFQILGVLETRVLDFDHVIMLSVNEGILPASEQGNSFIPYNLRKALGMPTIEYHDAIYAYYFYRFIQRASRVTLVYNAQSGGMLSGEMSRYLYQLKYDEHFQVQEDALTFQVSIPPEKPISIAKTGEVYDKLIAFAEQKAFTPTSLNTWLICSLKFYFRYLEDLKEKDEISEDVDASEFGKLVHKALYLIYKPYIGKIIKPETIEAIQSSEIPEIAIGEAFENLYPSRGSHTWKLSGKNLIIQEIILKYVRKVLEKDGNYAPFEMIALEAFIEKELMTGAISLPLKLGGYVDRIDSKDGVLRIIDYKTGEVVPNFTDFASLFTREKRKQKDAAFQCLLYAYVLADQHPEEVIRAGLYSVKKLFDSGFNPLLRFSKGEVLNDIQLHKEELHSELISLFNHIFDTNEVFTKTDDIKACENCAYKNICHR